MDSKQLLKRFDLEDIFKYQLIGEKHPSYSELKKSYDELLQKREEQNLEKIKLASLEDQVVAG
ncbi:MAG: hypothetical protein HW387_634 [Parachlamydiales bacterium]|nr:hypothetical protein [Parachlamydiales bacterium]